MFPKNWIRLTVLAWAPIIWAQPSLQFSNPNPHIPTAYSGLVRLPGGKTALVGSQTLSQQIGLSGSMTSNARMVVNGNPLSGMGGSGNDIPQAAGVDAQGNLWIAGNTDSDDFVLMNPIVARKVPYRTAGFVIEVDPNGKLLFATYLAGQISLGPTFNFDIASKVTALTIDGAGNVYVGGTTDEPDFPVTPGAALTTGPPQVADDEFGDTFFYSFVSKISPAGKLVYSTFLRTGTNECVEDGSACLGRESTASAVSSMAVNGMGILTVAGVESGISQLAYLLRLSSNGATISPLNFVPANGVMSQVAIAEDASGNLDVLGQYLPLVRPPGPENPAVYGTPGLFAAKLSPDGSMALYSTDLGQSADARVTGIVVDASGNPYLAGTSSSPQFPVLSGVPNLGGDFVLQLDPPGATPKVLFRFPTGTVTMPPALDASGRLLLAGSTGALLTVPPAYAFNTPAIVGFANAASYALNTSVVPGELVAIYGWDLNDKLQSPRVMIGGVAAPVLYSSSNQLNVQVPFETTTTAPQVSLVLGSFATQMPVAPSLGLFTVDGVNAAALNQDGSVNSKSNPAVRGSIVTLYGTGVMWPGGMQDGAVAVSAMPLNQDENLFQVVQGGVTPVNLLYAGAAPGLIDGAFQLNVQTDPNSNGGLTLLSWTGYGPGVAFASNPVLIYFK